MKPTKASFDTTQTIHTRFAKSGYIIYKKPGIDGRVVKGDNNECMQCPFHFGSGAVEDIPSQGSYSSKNITTVCGLILVIAKK